MKAETRPAVPSWPLPSCAALVCAAAVPAACQEVVVAWAPALLCPSSLPRIHPHKPEAGYVLPPYIRDEKTQVRRSEKARDWRAGWAANETEETCLYFLLCLLCILPSLPISAKAARWFWVELAGHVGYQEMETEEVSDLLQLSPRPPA